MFILTRKGLKPCVVVTGGAQIEQVLRTDAKKYKEGLDLTFMQHFLGKGLISKQFYGTGQKARVQDVELNVFLGEKQGVQNSNAWCGGGRGKICPVSI